MLYATSCILPGTKAVRGIRCSYFKYIKIFWGEHDQNIHFKYQLYARFLAEMTVGADNKSLPDSPSGVCLLSHTSGGRLSDVFLRKYHCPIPCE